MSVEKEMNLIQPEPPEYYLFKQYGLAVKQFLQETIYLKRFSRDKQPKIYYNTPRKAWAKVVQPIVNGNSDTPVCVFYLSDFQEKQGERMGGFVYIREESENDPNKFIYSFSPTIWKLSFKVSIWTKEPQDMDTILSQLLIYSMPPKLFAQKVDNAWCEIGTENVTDESELEPGEARDKVIRKGLNLYIPRAYLPRETFESNKILNINIRFGEDIEDASKEITSPVIL